MATREFRLPDLGEGLTESELVEWHISVGDTVTLNQTIADVETAKAVVQLPSPVAGVVTELCAEPGETVQVGTPIVRFEVGGGDAAPASVPDAPAASAPSAEPAAAAPAEPERQSVLVGYGPAAASGRAPARKARKGAFMPAATSIPAAPAAVATATPSAPAASTRTLATPPVRKLAHTLGVDLAQLTGSGPHGLVTRDDVQHAASAPSAQSAPASPSAPSAGEQVTSAPAPARAGFPAERRTPIKGVRKATAQAMVESAFTAPHASVFLTVDVTRTMKLVRRLTEAGDRASLLAVISKAVCLAAAAQPALNSHWDDDASEIVEWGHVNLGIAVAAPRGLMVPVVHDAHAKTVAELSDSIGELARTARAGELSPQQLSGGTITISNVGVFGIDAGTPILVPGQAAILATGAVQSRPWEHRGKVRLRDVMTLSLSFDHRLVDGEQGARFLTDVGRILSDPATVLGRV